MLQAKVLQNWLFLNCSERRWEVRKKLWNPKLVLDALVAGMMLPLCTFLSIISFWNWSAFILLLLSWQPCFDTNVYRAHFEFLSLVVRIYFFQVFISVSLHRLVYYSTHIFLTWNKSCIHLECFLTSRESSKCKLRDFMTSFYDVIWRHVIDRQLWSCRSICKQGYHLNTYCFWGLIETKSQ